MLLGGSLTCMSGNFIDLLLVHTIEGKKNSKGAYNFIAYLDYCGSPSQSQLHLGFLCTIQLFIAPKLSI